MSITIRLASLADEEEQLIEILDRNLPGRPNRKIQKRRHANPLGPGWSWVASPQGSDTIVAIASVFPRSFWVDGRKVVCGQVVEFAVEPPYRSLGPAVLLQRATFEPVNSGEVAFCYDCPPHDRGMSTFVRLGMHSSSDVIRYALLLRSDEFLGKRLGGGAWTRPLVATANAALQVRRSGRSVAGVEICRHDRPFDEEFSYLDQITSSLGIVRASRAAEELNWRYLEDPFVPSGSSTANLGRWRVLVARRAGELVGFAVLFILEDRTAWIADLFSRNIAEFGGALLEAVVDICRQEKVIRLDGLCSADTGFSSLLEHAGFRARERVYRVVAYEDASQTAKLLNLDLHWTFTNFEVT
jgi:GNAT superfamily N-acetyltransferase